MRRQISLKWYVVLTFMSLLIILVIGYSLLSAHFFILGMDNVTSGTMHEVLQSYVQSVPTAKRKHLNQFSGYQIAADWEQLPQEIRVSFSKPDGDNIMQKNHPDSNIQGPPTLYFLMQATVAGERYFISRTLDPEHANPLIGEQAHQSMLFLLTLSLTIAASILILLWLLLKQISRPVSRLGNWARNLNESNLADQPPDFGYPELNELATLVRSSLSSVQQSLEREQRFLRHSSHELRTPIAVIRNNIELLYKIQKKLNSQPDPRQAQIVKRIDRASLTMKNLTETLLWLSRESDFPAPLQECNLDELIENLISENRYLIKDKPVRLRISTASCHIKTAMIPARIVLGNLIRNAFQHSREGEISIQQQDKQITICNLKAPLDSRNDLGFGLGLQLTEQLTARMGWTCLIEMKDNHHQVNLTIH